MKKVFAIYGASGFGREVMPLAKAQISDLEATLVFIDDGMAGTIQNGFDVISFDKFNALELPEKYVCLAIADAAIRRRLYEKLEKNDIKHWSVFASNAVILDQCCIGDNSVLSPFVTLTSNITIGKSFQANLYSYIGHDCVIGDFVTFAPSVKCNGNVRVEDNVYIGTGAMIKQGKPGNPLVIGEGAVIGMGAIVTKNVPPGSMVIATPSKPIERKGLGG